MYLNATLCDDVLYWYEPDWASQLSAKPSGSRDASLNMEQRSRRRQARRAAQEEEEMNSN